ncbi:hypothetical protein BOX15_Mlig026865g3 [Macrostomum lignano]|uniref:Peptidase M12B domain-containing protein n=1 Tax=Macrostomum lignano TaxID=282301 RepID=A0A267GEG7_9PLAT|nr:hypothetical protein BOX15_Mlig026865g3 [Macrostomum lignano]
MARLCLLLPLLLLALPAIALAEPQPQPELIAAFKREPFRYYTAGGLYEFRRRRSGEEEVVTVPEGESEGDDFDVMQMTYRQPIKRSGEHRSAVMELLVVVDNGLYQSHLSRIENSKSKQSVKAYYEYFVGYINKVFENAPTNIRVTVVPAGIAVIKTKDANDWSERSRVSVGGRDFLLAQQALAQFRQWLQRHRNRLPQFDHAMALTQYHTGIRINGEVHEIKGVAQLGQMCNVGANGRGIHSVSLVHDSGTLAGALTAVHEIGHSLGLPHDGERSSAACPDAGRYVMSAALAMSEEAASFSNCSQRALQRFLESPRASCLFHSEADPDRRLVETSLLPGQIYSKDYQCQRQTLEGIAEPRFCKIPWFSPTTLEMSCTSLFCQDGAGGPGGLRCAGSVPAIMGTPCGNKKICLNNRCTYSETAPCCPLEEEDEASCGRLRQMLGCQNKLLQLYCCKFCGHKCE